MATAKAAETRQRNRERERKIRMEQAYDEAELIVASGRCPTCRAPLRRNSSILGWWQCSQYGAVGFRADNTKPSCSFQTFTRH
jgi:hypothetical protein